MMHVKVRETGATPGVLKKELPRLQKLSFAAIGRYWHESFRPNHFTTAGKTIYGYRPRTKEYEIRKAKEYGHRLPLVYTGTSQALSRIQDVRATRNRVRVVLNTPALNFKPGGHDLRGEMTRITKREEELIQKRYDDRLQQAIDSLQSSRTKQHG